MIDPNLANPEKHIQSFLSDYAKEHPNSDPAGRDSILAKQLLDPKEAVHQVVLMAVGADIRNSDTPSKLFVHDAPGNWGILAVCSTRSFSRGSVHIASSDPTQHPLIDPAYYAHPLDLDLTGRAILHIAKMTELEPLKSKLRTNEDGGPLMHPGVGLKTIPKTLEEAKEIARNNTVTEYHPVGSCAMLPREKGGVVDSQLKVYGTTNVRVVDAAIFPTHVQGNIVSLVYAVAEKAADVIKGNQ
jgi:choline dehydrogenase